MTALVTGAAGAIGSAIVAQLLAEGERVIAHDLSAEALARLSDGRETDGDSTGVGTVIPFAGDLLDGSLAAELDRILGGYPLHRVIAAHGIDGSGTVESLDSTRFRRVMAVNAESVVRLLEATRSALARGGGAFVVISSQAGLVAEADNAAYCASKFAVIGWASALRAPLAREGIRIRIAAPGCTETPLFVSAQREFAAANGVSLDEFLQRRLDRIPVGRFATPEQTGSTAVYLSGPAPTPFILAATGGEVLH